MGLKYDREMVEKSGRGVTVERELEPLGCCSVSVRFKMNLCSYIIQSSMTIIIKAHFYSISWQHLKTIVGCRTEDISKHKMHFLK